MTYGGIVGVVFSIVLAITASMIYVLAARVVSESEDALMDQIISNTQFLLAESSDVFVRRLEFGVHTFALPTAYTVYDVLQRASYSVDPPGTFMDCTHETLEQPTSADSRYPCDMTENSDMRSKRGCTTGSNLKAISREASALFITGLLYDGSNRATLLSDNQAGANLTAHIDTFVEPAWQYVLSSQGWMGAYVALEQQAVPSQPDSMLRTFPGFVGDLSPGSGVRTYDPTVRPWYLEHSMHQYLTTEKIAMTNEGQDRYRLVYTAPYVSADGNGNLISANLGVHDNRGVFLGVAGTDVKVSTLQDIVKDIHVGTEGSVHLYHYDTGRVAASPQWHDAATDSDIMLVEEIKVVPSKSNSPTLSGSHACSGREEMDVDGETQLVVREKVLAGSYCIAAVVPKSEILEPITSQVDEINSTADTLFITSLVVLVICVFGFVLPCALCLAAQMSTPLCRTSDETATIAGNIGGDLLQGVDVQKPSHQVGPIEVAHLREGFMELMWRLKRKRGAVVQTPNPLFGKLQTPDPPEFRGVRVKTLVDLSSIGSDVDMEITGWQRWNTIPVRLGGQLICPMVLALLVVIIFTSVQMFTSVDKWIAPVKEQMIETELEMLDMRAYERALLVQEIIAVYETTLIVMKDYTQKLYSNEFEYSDYSTSAFSPYGMCPVGATSCISAPTIEQPDLVRGTRDVSFDYSVWYIPDVDGQQYVPNLVTDPSQVIDDSPTAVSEHEGRATNLENMLRVAYFSSNAIDVYLGLEAWESYMMYPFADLQSFADGRKCQADETTTVPRYTIFCRKWYYDAKQPGTRNRIVYNDVGTSSVTGQAFVSLSTGCYTTADLLIGVVGIDLNLGEIEQILANTDLYEEGRAYLFDSQGYTITHPDLDESQAGDKVPISQVVSGDDANFRRIYEEKVVDEFGQIGKAVIPWDNPSTGEIEYWYYSFLPAGPYQLVAAVVDRDVQEAARKLEDDLEELTIVHTVISLVLFVVAAILLIWVSWKFQGRFVTPVIKLTGYLREAQARGYDEMIPAPDPKEVWSFELRSVLQHMQKLLVAVRFSNPDYHKGDKAKELMNLRQATEIVKATENARGLGVCLNNRGLCVRGMTEEQLRAVRLTEQESNVVETLKEAVNNARGLADEDHVDMSMDTVGARLLSLALARLDKGQVDESCANLQEALEIHSRTRSWTSLARMANIISTLPPEKQSPQIKAIQNKALNRALQLLKGSAPAGGKDEDNPKREYRETHVEIIGDKPAMLGAPADDGSASAASSSSVPQAGQAQEAITLMPEDGPALAQLCWILGTYAGDHQYHAWAVDRVPNLDHNLLGKLAFHAKLGGKRNPHWKTVDEYMRGIFPGRWVEGMVHEFKPNLKFMALPPKCMLFVLDASGSMAGSFLNTCKESIRTIVDQYTEEEDYVGLIAFATYTKVMCDIIPKKGNNQVIHDAIDAVKTFGGTAFYDAVLEATEKLHTVPPTMPKWLIALTDGADGHSRNDKQPPGVKGTAALARIPNLNVACITVGKLPAETIQCVGSYGSAAIRSGGKGLHIEAKDSAAIKDAFEAIATAMADEGLAEHL